MENTPKMKVYMFGGLRVYIGGEKVPDKHWTKAKAKVLFAHLVTRFGREVGREVLISSLWPGMDESRAVDNLYVMWSSLKKATANKDGETPYISNNGSLYRIESTLVDSDVEEFDGLARSALFGDLGKKEMRDIFIRMDQVYTGDLLSGVNCDSHLLRLRERYRATYVDCLLSASDTMLRDKNYSEALWFARRAIGTDSQREDVYQTLMRAQGMAGQRTSAMETFFQCKNYLDEELGIPLSKKTMDIYQKLLEDRI